MRKYSEKKPDVYLCSKPRPVTEFGYWVSLLTFANGIENGKNTHLSLDIGLVRHETDVLLQWPFRAYCRVCLFPCNGTNSSDETREIHKKPSFRSQLAQSTMTRRDSTPLLRKPLFCTDFELSIGQSRKEVVNYECNEEKDKEEKNRCGGDLHISEHFYRVPCFADHENLFTKCMTDPVPSTKVFSRTDKSRKCSFFLCLLVDLM